MTTEPTGKAKGGAARAQSLTPEERSEIAKKAASARWSNVKATHRGEVIIGDIRIPCAVLEDGRRILAENGVTIALAEGGASGASKRIKKSIQTNEKSDRPLMPVFLAPERLKPFISNELMDGPLKLIQYMDKDKVCKGYDASILPAVCEIWLKARDAGVLQAQQLPKAQRAEILMRGLAHIGIMALVDEATGYQAVRERDALQAILDKYLRKELAAWAKRFPDEFYHEIFRLKGWPRTIDSVSRPSVIGHYTNDIVYERLAPHILEELQARNPKNEKGQRKGRHHQLLTDEVGHPALAQHLYLVIGFMKASSSWDGFINMLDRVVQKKGQTIPLALD